MDKPGKKQALRPKTFISQLPTFKGEKEATTKGATQAEKQLAAMSRMAGWQVLKEFIGEIWNELDAVNDAAIAGGANFEQLGQNALVISQTKTVLKKILDKVEDAKEAIDKTKETE